jgi:hypothetical protein
LTAIGNIVIETATGSGTGNLTLALFPYYRRFSAAFGTGSSNTFYYCIRHRTADEYEVGVGYMSDADTLVRDSVLESSNSNALVNFTAGDKDCINDIPAAYQVPGVGAVKNDILKYNGSEWLTVPEGTTFTFSIASFTHNLGSTTVEIGTGVWKAIGAITFDCSYNNPPATNGYVSHSGWSNLTMSGAGFDQATASVEAVNYPASAGGTKVFTLNATDGTDSDTSTLTFTFVNRRFWGKSTTASGYTESDIEGLASNELSNSKAKTFSSTTGTGEYIIYAYPTRLGTATFSINGFAGGFISPETVSVTNASGFTENYYVYRSLLTDLGTVSVGAS